MKILPCQSEHLELLLATFAEVYRHNPRLQERDYVEWQFGDGCGGYRLDLAFQDDRLVGFLGYVPLRFRWDGVIEDGCLLQNWWSHSQDGTGLALLAGVTRRFDNVLAVNATPQAVQIYQKLRYQTLTALEREVLIVDSSACAQVFGVDRDVLQASARSLDQLPSLAVEEVERFPVDVDFNSYGPARDGAYLNWRYIAIPRHDYRLLLYGSEMGVYRVEEIAGTPHRAVRVLEWTFSGQRGLSHLRQVARSQGAILIDSFNVRARLGEAFREAGALPIPHLLRPPKLGAPIAAALRRKSGSVDLERLYLTRGDGDVDRIKF